MNSSLQEFEEAESAPVPPPASEPEPTRKELHKTVWNIALPSVLTMLLQTVNALMDTLFVGHLPQGTAALAATGVGGSAIFLMISCSMGVASGTMALVARFTGAREPENVRAAMGQSLTLGVLIGAVLGAVAFFCRGMLASALLGGKSNALSVQLCTDFLAGPFLAVVPMFLLNVIQSGFRGLGDTKTPFYFSTVVIGIHILLNYCLIWGKFGFPRMEVRGAGIAFAVSHYIGTLLFFLAMFRKPALSPALQPRYLRLNREWAKRILKIGVPSSIQNFIRVGSMMAFGSMLARTPDKAAALAALQIGIRSEGVAFMPGFGYSMAAGALTGQNLGAKRPDRAERYAMAATGQAMLVMAFMACLFFAFARPITQLFSQDPLVQELGIDYLQINAVCEPFLALGMVLMGALQGAGDTIRPTVIVFFTMIVLRLPLANYLMFHRGLGAQGAWWALVITTFVSGCLTFAWFRLGHWKKTKV